MSCVTESYCSLFHPVGAVKDVRGGVGECDGEVAVGEIHHRGTEGTEGIMVDRYDERIRWRSASSGSATCFDMR